MQSEKMAPVKPTPTIPSLSGFPRKKRINFMVTAFRDGFQSAYGARVFTKDFLPAVEAAANAGIKHFEMGGGARFQSLYFYCNEDAFQMMDTFRKTTGPDANLQTLARGINVVGLDSQPEDIIKLHAQLFKKHGVTTIRNFDALNDVNNLTFSGQSIVEAGLKHEVCVSMMGLPQNYGKAHTPEFYIEVLRKFLAADVHFDSICFKDASGTTIPAYVYETVKQARRLVGDKKNLVFHTHDTAGTSMLCYKAALEAGASQIDLSLAPVSGGTCQPDLLTMWHALRETEYQLDIDPYKIMEVEEVFKDCMKDYFTPPEALAVEPLIPFFPMPGGALTANTQMLRDTGLMNRYEEIVSAMGEAVALGGFGTSVTPVSQFYFQQAFNNVMFGKWEKIAEGYGKMVLGYFGKTPSQPDPKVVTLASEQLGLPPVTESPLAINNRDSTKGVAAAKAMLQEGGVPITDENIFIAATCKEKGIAFLRGEARTNVRKKSAATSEAAASVGTGAGAGGTQAAAATATPIPAENVPEGTCYVTVNNREYEVMIDSESGTAIVNGVGYPFQIACVGGAPAYGAGHPYQPMQPQASPPIARPRPAQVPASTAPAVSTNRATGTKAGAGTADTGDGETTIPAPLPGIVLRIQKKAGDPINNGEVLLVLESMKMETPINSPVTGKVVSILVAPGDQVATGQNLAVIKKG